jgi:GxxExxY protein
VGNGFDKVNRLTGSIVDAAIKVHKLLGPGLLESAYEACLQFELVKRGFLVRRQFDMPLQYEGIRLDVGYRSDLLVENCVVVECKAVRELTSLDKAQVISYLRLSKCPVGLLINFHVELLKNGIQRFAN